MLNTLLEYFKYRKWIKTFTKEIKKLSNIGECWIEAEKENWPFVPDNIFYDWRECDPVDAAREAISYYYKD